MKLTNKKNTSGVINLMPKLMTIILFYIALFGATISFITLLGCSNSDDGNDPQPIGTGNVMGSVKDERGNPYPNVLVELSRNSTTDEKRTDSNGNFGFDSKGTGMYTIATTLPLSTELLPSNTSSVEIQANQTASVEFVIRPIEVKASLNFGNVQLLEEIKDKNGNTPTSPNEPLYAANIFDEPLGLLTEIRAPDGHHITLAEYQTALGDLIVHCDGESSEIEIDLKGMIPNGTYTFWLAYLNKKRSIGESIDFMNDFVNFNNPPIGAASGTENIVVAGVDGTINTTLKHSSCILTDQVALVIPILYHINGNTFGGGHVPDSEEVVHMLAYFQ